MLSVKTGKGGVGCVKVCRTLISQDWERRGGMCLSVQNSDQSRLGKEGRGVLECGGWC